MMVCPVSSLVKTRKVGSSSARRWSAVAIFLLINLGLRLDGHRDDRVGNEGGSSRIGKSSSQSVSPVVMFLMPTMAAISPE